jgi:hypothetical protein
VLAVLAKSSLKICQVPTDLFQLILRSNEAYTVLDPASVYRHLLVSIPLLSLLLSSLLMEFWRWPIPFSMN